MMQALHTISLSFLMVYFVTYGGTFATSLTAVGKMQAQVLTAALWLLLIFRLARGKQITRLWLSMQTPMFLLLALLSLGLLVAAEMSFFPRFSLEVAFQSIWYLGLAWLTWLYCHSDEDRERVLTAVLVGGSVVLTFALIQFAGWLLNPQRDTSPAGQRVMIATMNSHNDLAGYLVLLFPLALARMPATRSRMLYAAFSLLTLFAILFTYSRCGWVGAVAALSVYALVSLITGQCKNLADLIRSQKLICLGGLLLLIVALLFSPHQWFWERVRTMFTASDYGATSRLMMWRHLWEMWRDRPAWGWGCGMLPIVFPRYIRIDEIRELIFHAHNIILQYAVDGGLVSLVLFLAALCVGFLQALRSIHPDDDLLAARRQTGLIAALVGFLIYSLFNCTQAIPAITGTFWMLTGVLVSGSKSRMRTLFCVPVWCLGLVLLFYVFLFAPEQRRAEPLRWIRAHLLFDRAIRRHNPALQTDLLDRAIQLDPAFLPYNWTKEVIEYRRGRLPHYLKGIQDPTKVLGAAMDSLTCSNRIWMHIGIEPVTARLITCLDLCIRNDPALPQYRLSKALIAARLNRYDEAERELTTVTTRFARRPPVAWLILAQIHELRGEWTRARGELEEGLRQAKLRFVMPGYQMRIRYRRLGLENESLDALPDLYSEDLLNWEMAKVLERLGKTNEVARYRAEALRLNPLLSTQPPTGYVWESMGERSKHN